MCRIAMSSSKKAKKTGSKKETSTLSLEDDDHEFVTMAAVSNLLAVQESMLKAMFQSTVSSLTARVDDLVRTVAELKASIEFSQDELLSMKPIVTKMEAAESSLAQVNNSLEYLENQSRRNNIRVSGIKESPGETWAISEEKVKAAVKNKLGIELDIERAHRIERRQSRRTSTQSDNEGRPRTIVCKLKCWKQREQVIREARKNKPQGLYISEDLARATLLKREGQINTLKEARRAGKKAYFVLDRPVIPSGALRKN